MTRETQQWVNLFVFVVIVGSAAAFILRSLFKMYQARKAGLPVEECNRILARRQALYDRRLSRSQRQLFDTALAYWNSVSKRMRKSNAKLLAQGITFHVLRKHTWGGRTAQFFEWTPPWTERAFLEALEVIITKDAGFVVERDNCFRSRDEFGWRRKGHPDDLICTLRLTVPVREPELSFDN